MIPQQLATPSSDWFFRCPYKHPGFNLWTKGGWALAQLPGVSLVDLCQEACSQDRRIHLNEALLLSWGSSTSFPQSPGSTYLCSYCEKEALPWAFSTGLYPRPTNLQPYCSLPLWGSQEQSMREYQPLGMWPGCGVELEPRQSLLSSNIRSRREASSAA